VNHSGGRTEAAPHQIRTRSLGAINNLSLEPTLNRSYHESTFRIGPFTRNILGEWGSLTTCLRIKSSDAFPRHACAQPNSTRCSPLNPSSTGAGFAFRDVRYASSASTTPPRSAIFSPIVSSPFTWAPGSGSNLEYCTPSL